MDSLIGAAALAVVVVAFVTWQCADWIEARAELARERARGLKLENDSLARDLAAQDRRPSAADSSAG